MSTEPATASAAAVTRTAGVTIVVNDQPRALGAGATVSSLVAELGLSDRKGVAIAVNGDVAPRSTWFSHPLRDGDRVLVIRATQGG